MPVNIVKHFWLEAEEISAGQAPTSDPTTGATPFNPSLQDPSQNPSQEQDPSLEQEPDDVSQDPEEADLPEEDLDKDFWKWKKEFFELSIKGNTEDMLNSIKLVDTEGLESSQLKFLSDNMQILLYRQDANIAKASKEIRKLMKTDLDRSNPATSIMQHITNVLEKDGPIQAILVKLSGMYDVKGPYHRKFIASLIGGVQTGGGGDLEDIVYVDNDLTVNISTRFCTQFGEIHLGNWSLKDDDPEKYLADVELERLKEGSPEEKQVLRRRIILESIAQKFEKRSFLIHCVSPNGTIFSMGYELGTSIRSAYKEGKLIVRGQKAESRDAMITDDGKIVPLIDIDVMYVRDTGETDMNGKPVKEEVPFMKRRNCILYLTADLEVLKEASAGMTGFFLHESPYNGNPEDIRELKNCNASLSEILNKQCTSYTIAQQHRGPKPQPSANAL
jgi:hypothetical protein